jgi:lysophospholipase L1-like esterase
MTPRESAQRPIDFARWHTEGWAQMTASAPKPRSRLLAGLTAAAALVLLATTGTALAIADRQTPVPGRTVAASARCTSPRISTARGALPVLAVVGASFSAGVGARGAALAWPADLGRLLHMRVVVSADAGAGYLSRGVGRRGPFARLTDRLNLARLRPAVLLVQGGHNDVNRPAAALARSVRGLIGQVRCATPGTRIGIVSVFPSGNTPSRAAVLADRTIVAAARAADPRVVVFDPIAQHWRFPRLRDQLHPTIAGHQWIAERVAAGLRGAAVPATPAVHTA